MGKKGQVPWNKGRENLRDPRIIGRIVLVKALWDEFKHGNSISKLYASLLLRAMLEQDPKLIERLRYRFEDCGVFMNEADRALAGLAD